MDPDNDPLYGRRLKGTPAFKFVNKVIVGIFAASAVIGCGSFYLVSLMKSSREEKPTFFYSKFLEQVDLHHARQNYNLFGRHIRVAEEAKAAEAAAEAAVAAGNVANENSDEK